MTSKRLKNKVDSMSDLKLSDDTSSIHEIDGKQLSTKKIPITKYPEYFDAIIKDDVNKVESILWEANTEERYMLVNAHFDFEDDDFKELFAKTTRAMLPFHLAVCFSSPNVALTLIRNKVDPLAIDSDGKNILHTCSVAGFYNHELEEDIAGMIYWLEENISNDKFQFLAHHENFDGLRPLEFAAQQGTLFVMKALLESSAYVTSKYQRGLASYRLHDVTEYETGERNSRSPLNMLAHLDSSKLDSPSTKKIILNPLILGWINGKIKSNIIPLIFWIGIRLSLLVFFMFVDNDSTFFFKTMGYNQTMMMFCPDLLHLHTHLAFPITLSFFLIIMSVIIVTLDILEFIKYRVQRMHIKSYNINGRKNIIANSRFFFIVQITVLVIFIVCTSYYVYILITLNSFIPWMYTSLQLARILLPVLLLWSLLYFMQLIPSLGPKVMSLHTMITDMGSFLAILALTTLLFIHVFQSFVQMNSKAGCADEFSSHYNTLYTVFRMMLNMYDTTQVNVNERFVYEILHMLYVFMVGIMLVNFLIAVMTESAAKIAANEQTILKINQLALVITLEERLYWLARNVLYKKIRKFGFYCRDGHCYLRSKVDRRGELLNKQDI